MSEERGIAPSGHPRRETPAATLESAMINGDVTDLSDEDRLKWYRMRCEAAGLDPRAQPFLYIKLSGRLVLYATKAATDQLASNRGLSVEVMSRAMTDGGIYEVVCRVRDDSGRVTEDLGAVFAGDAKGEALANLRMRATTKAKRRTILAHCGLGMLDETETEHIPGAARVSVSERGEVLGELPAAAPAPEPDSQEARNAAARRLFAIAKEHGIDTVNLDAMRAKASEALGKPVPHLRELTAAERGKVADWIQYGPLPEEPAAADDGDDPFGDAEADTVPVPPRESSGAGLAQQSGL